ncbi:hypothetical protein PR202_gb26305 [Eleusine coracana subsp. coracana]|uniref:DUF3730 domain-containing protein n=1 Tax=Eleusine coracana subsp. coracana TaxID=191504 RepID=A0AAV5FNL0_ELECO|nr:hypothetical protein PR202_gb26305 [Eleusine coracana subsp. coracana]
MPRRWTDKRLDINDPSSVLDQGLSWVKSLVSPFILRPSSFMRTHTTKSNSSPVLQSLPSPATATPWPLPPPAPAPPRPVPSPDSSTAPASRNQRCSATPSRPSSATSFPSPRPSPRPPTTPPPLSSPRPTRLWRPTPRPPSPASRLAPPTSSADLAFPLLLAPLAAPPSSRLASCLVKAVAALASCALRSGARFAPHDHPFVQALASGVDGARAELTRQAARMVAEGVDGVVGFLRPFVMLAVVRKGDASFARDLIGALAAAAAAAAKPGVVIPVLKLLEESLLHFGRGDGEEVRLWLSSAECLVDAYLRLLESLPSLAIHSFVLPLALQWISPMLKRDTNLALYAIAVRLLCKIWIVTDWAFPNLQFLTNAPTINFYTAWKVISKELLDYAAEPNIAHSLCALLRWGAMDAEAYSGISQELIGILWNIGTSVTSSSEPSWIKARGTAFHSLSYYKVSLIQDAIPDFWKQNYKVFTSECNVEVLKAMENFQDEIIKFEHINRRRAITDKRVAVHKFEKLLDVFPQTVLKDLSRVHAAYEQAFTEMAESIYISRNLEVALLVLHSWKSFVANWMQAVVALFDTKESSKLNKTSKAANDIFKIVPPAAHLVVSSAAEFLVRWLLQYEHEHQQWSAAVSLGLIFNCFHPTDKKSKFQVIKGLLEVISKTESYLVKGACGLALGYACHGLLTGAHNAAEPEVEATTKLNERASVEDILHTLVTSLIQLCPSSSYSLKKLSICGIDSTGCMEENVNNFDDDPWAIAGLVLGLGNSVVALYRLGAYGAVTDVKNILISWIPDADSSSALFNEINSVSLCLGSCLALPAVMAFCQRVELLNDDLDMMFNRYTSLASKLLNLNKSGTVFQNLLMAICIGAGSFLSCICMCLSEVVSEESGGFPFIKKCIECLLPLLTICNDGQPEFVDEWSAAIKCLANAQKTWLDDMLQVRNATLITNGEHVDVAKKIIIRARLCASGYGSAHELGNIKITILCTKADDIWWSVLVEVVAAIYSTENSIKRQWLLDALDIGCVADHPLTALRFIGLLCSSCCIYMPLLIVNSTNVLSDLPVTLPSFLSSSIWDDNRNSVAEKLWLLTTRIYTWAEQLAQRNVLTEHDHIHGSEAEMANFLADVLRSTCIAIEDYLTVDKQLKLANLEALRS